MNNNKITSNHYLNFDNTTSNNIIKTREDIKSNLNKFNINNVSKLSKPSDHIEELRSFLFLAAPPDVIKTIKSNTFLSGNTFTVSPDSYSNNVKIYTPEGQEFSLTILKIEDAYGSKLIIPIIKNENNTQNIISFDPLTMHECILEFSKKYGYGSECVLNTKFKPSGDALIPVFEFKLKFKQEIEKEKLVKQKMRM